MKILDKKENLKQELMGQPVVLIKFGAEWCGPCKMIDPILAKLSESTKDAKFISVDVDIHSKLAEEYRIKSIPALVVLKNGEEVDRKVGFQTAQQIKELLNS